jgi:hypothetical protein
MRKIIFICIAIAAALPVAAQKTKQEKKDERKQRINALIKQEEEGVIAFRKHSLFAFKQDTIYTQGIIVPAGFCRT